jgi:WD40 repeat protein/mono/diheme cytochrome c family protein
MLWRYPSVALRTELSSSAMTSRFFHSFTVRLAGLVTGLALLGLQSSVTAAPKKEEVIDPNTPVSFYKHIRPIFQGQCYGCHQPSKAKGDYIMTEFTRLLKGGEEGNAVVAGQPDTSHLLKEINLDAKGKAEMPKNAAPLHETQIALIKRWIIEGAKDDTPASARQQYDMEHLPLYRTAPLVTSLDYSPDGKLIAVAGYHEVLLHKADGTGIEARLVGLSERIQKVAFSPDGTKLAVAGGNPGRMGEIQVWEVAQKKLIVSAGVTFDTLYGASWSPDGRRIAFGGADNSLRAIDAATGKEVLFSGSANDWVLDTVWSKDGTHVAAGSRDMSVKLTESATQRFIDNVTSITPGALKGGIHAIARHPQRDEILIGGADGLPQVYKLYRETVRKIGDNANLIRKFPVVEGRIFAVDYSPDGKTIVCASTLGKEGTISLYSSDFDSTLPPEIKKILEGTTARDVKVDQTKMLEEYLTRDVKLNHRIKLPSGGAYAVSFSPDGKSVAAAGEDGKVRLIEAASGSITKEFVSVPLSDEKTLAERGFGKEELIQRTTLDKALTPESLPKGAQVVSLEVTPKAIKIGKPTEYAQLLVTAKFKDGSSADVTRLVKMKAEGVAANISPRGLVRPESDGKGSLLLTLGSQKVTVPMEVSGTKVAFKPDYVRDVMPVLSKAGCNMGTCHGSKDGKNGFKLSLRGYDPIYDVTAFSEELWSRRANVAAPEHSLMLLKASGSVPHEGGQVTVPGELYYETIKSWIAHGAQLKVDSPRVTRIEVFPHNPVVNTIGSKQQMRVLATYADGITKDVTAEAFIESGNMDVAEADKQGLITTIRRGEAPMLARFEGAYAATTVTVMGDRTGFAWVEPPKFNKIDEFVAAKWKRMKTLPSELCTDTEFIRRVYLDLTGLPPGAEDVRSFLADPAESRIKREQLVDKLVGSPAYVDQWANKWADMLQVNSKFLGDEGAKLFREWIRKQVADNTPYDQFAKSILTASGSNKDNPAASYYKILRTPEETMENTTHLFLATRFNCNKCHDHPFEKWNQDQYYQTSAFFAQIGFETDPSSAGKTIGGSAVEGAKPLYEIVKDTGKGEVMHLRTSKEAPPIFPFPAKFDEKAEAPRREKLANWMTSADNAYFAMSYANRIWGYLTGTGVIEPLDDIRAGNPPSNPELLSYLTQEFISSGFNVRHLMQIICKSRTYQLSIAANEWNEDDKINYSHAKPRRLSAEALYDTIYAVTGTTSKIPGVAAGTRAAQLADSQIKLADGFLGNFGRPVRESACECERSNDVQLGPVMALISGPTVGDAISDPANAIAKLAKESPDDGKMVEELFMRILNRPPTPAEVNTVLASSSGMEQENKSLLAEWASSEVQQAPVIAKLEQERHEKIKTAETILEDYQKQQAPIIAKQEADRLATIKKAEDAVKAAATAAAAKQPEWETYLDLSTEWVPLELEVSDVKGVQKIDKQPDGSLFVTSLPEGQAVEAIYTLKARTDLTKITGFKLEVLPDERLPSNGPGLSPDGNFVLTEFGVAQKVIAQQKTKEMGGYITPLSSKADFEQKDFAVANSINGKNEVSDKGWAVAGSTGRRHEAIFETDPEKTGLEGGTGLTFVLRQGYQRQRYQIGRFKIYVTTSARPLRYGASQTLAQAVRLSADKRTKEQQAALTESYLLSNTDYQKTKQTLAASRKPLPADPKLAELEVKLVEAQRPIVLDPKLVQLRRDAELSKQQLVSRRLTSAQDLAWALINSPSFLFNR